MRRQTRYRKKRTHTSGKGFLLRLILLGIAAILLLLGLLRQIRKLGQSNYVPTPVDERFFLPSSRGQVVHHGAYSLSYDEDKEQAEWVAYELTKEQLRKPNVPRTNWFEEDPQVTTGSAHYYDYKGSGYTRGHLAPAGDMAQDTATMRESFYMSNVSPQLRHFNGGIWRELEENVRDWAYDKGRLYIVTGPMWISRPQRYIGKNRVAVPQFFYKIVLDFDAEPPEGAGWVLPHEKSEVPLRKFEVSIDSVELLTGIDFFPDMMTKELEAKVESTVHPARWPIDKKRYEKRLRIWNQQ